MVEREGLRIEGLDTNGNGHLAAVVVAPNGNSTRLVFSNTASDSRAAMNKRGDLRRFARANPAPATTSPALAQAVAESLLPSHSRPRQELILTAPETPQTLPKVNRNVLPMKLKIKVVRWMLDNASIITGAATLADREAAAQLATEAMGFSVTVGNLEGLLESAELAWASRRAAPAILPCDFLVLASEVLLLCGVTGREPGQAFKNMYARLTGASDAG